LYAANVVKVRRHYIRWAAQRQIIHEASHQLRLQAQQLLLFFFIVIIIIIIIRVEMHTYYRATLWRCHNKIVAY